jgi:hypothetical protein
MINFAGNGNACASGGYPADLPNTSGSATPDLAGHSTHDAYPIQPIPHPKAAVLVAQPCGCPVRVIKSTLLLLLTPVLRCHPRDQDPAPGPATPNRSANSRHARESWGQAGEAERGQNLWPPQGPARRIRSWSIG